MAPYFLDSWAIVQQYLQEPGHAWIETLRDPAKGDKLNITEATLVEMVTSILSEST